MTRWPLVREKAFEEFNNSTARNGWPEIRFLGIDGLPNSGQTWVDRRLLTATIAVPANAGKATEMLVHALQTDILPKEMTFTVSKSYPPIEELGKCAVLEPARSGGRRW